MLKTAPRKVSDSKAYERVVGVFKRHKNGITQADVAAATGLPLTQVKTLVPVAADEYSARLEVTESSEILYSFPNGFTSRYRGAFPFFKKFLSSFVRFGAASLKLFFKIWIMVMLFGYFLVFMAIAIASLFISVSGSSKNRRGGRGGMNFSFGIFDLLIRLWFYSELFGGGRRRSRGAFDGFGRERKIGAGRPLHRAVFSFVFGEDDPNRDWETSIKKSFVSYLRRQRGVVSVPELMTLTGEPPHTAENLILSLCAEFGGSPEVTEEGTVVYRFDEILLSGEKAADENPAKNYASPPALYKKLKSFSANPKKMNFWFGLVNTVNLLFGSYFLYKSFNTGAILNEAGYRINGIYGNVYYLLDALGANPLPLIQTALGLVPLVFSVLFWLIPAIRSLTLKKENKSIRFANFRIWGFGRIWSKPSGFKPEELQPGDDVCRPSGDLNAAQNQLVKEMGAYSSPEVSIDDNQKEVYVFPELRREKDAIERYRVSLNPLMSQTGKTIFDSGS